MNFTLPPGESGSQARRGLAHRPSPAVTTSDPPAAREGEAQRAPFPLDSKLSYSSLSTPHLGHP
jgi:hypothetical protein